MSMLEEFRQEIADKIQHYSQDEGMKDHEIADILRCSRATVNRVRQAFGIPTANLNNRLDKECLCDECGKTYLIRRKERRKKRCKECQDK